jgi:NADH-quinone oxidoreductase subunit I
MNGFIKYMSGLFHGVWTLLVGMKVTGSYFFRPWTIVTRKYPENRKKLKMFDRYKGVLIMPHNEENQNKCTGCGICELNCPNGSIEVLTYMAVLDDGKKKKTLDKYIYHLGMCTFCNLCVTTCPSDAITWGKDFEQAVFSRAALNKILNNEGSTLMKGVE